MKPRGVCLLGASLVLGVSAARAADPPPIVRVYVAGTEEAVSGARDAVQELCARSNVAVVVHDAAGADEALLSTGNERSLAEAYVDLRPEMPARVVVVDGETHQELERRELPQDATLEISIETAAHIVCAAVDSSLSARAAQPRPTPAEPTSAPVPAPAAPSPTLPRRERAVPSALAGAREPAWRSSLALFAATEDFGAGFRGGLGGAFALAAGSGRFHVGGLITLEGYPSAGVEAANASASFTSLGGRVGPTIEWQATRSAEVFCALGIGIDRAELDARVAAPGTRARATPATTDGVAAGLLGVRLQLSRSLGLLLGLDADLALSRHRYVLASAQGSQPFFQASRVRPVGVLGLNWSFGGTGGAPHELVGGR